MLRFMKKLLPYLLWCLVLLMIPVIIDPYNIFHVESIRNNGIEPNKNYIKTKYILAHPDKFDAYLFGSSRVGAIHTENIKEYHCYNMTYSGGLPQENLENLEVMLQAGVKPACVLLGVDEMSCFQDPARHRNQYIRMPYPKEDKITFYTLYMNPLMALQSIPAMLKGNNNIVSNEVFYEYGWWIAYDQESNCDFSNAEPAWDYTYIDRMEDTLGEIEQIVKLCEENGIELIVFTNPNYYITYEKAVENGYLDFLYELAQITDYYNFSGLNSMTTDNQYYLEWVHYNAKLGDMIINYLFHYETDDKLLEQGFGLYVTKDNIEQVEELLINQLERKS